MVAGEAASGATWTASRLESGWLELCFDQEILEVCWSSVGYQLEAVFRDGFFRQSKACSTGSLFFVRAVNLRRLGWYVMTSGTFLLQQVIVQGVRSSSLLM